MTGHKTPSYYYHTTVTSILARVSSLFQNAQCAEVAAEHPDAACRRQDTLVPDVAGQTHHCRTDLEQHSHVTLPPANLFHPPGGIPYLSFSVALCFHASRSA